MLEVQWHKAFEYLTLLPDVSASSSSHFPPTLPSSTSFVITHPIFAFHSPQNPSRTPSSYFWQWKLRYSARRRERTTKRGHGAASVNRGFTVANPLVPASLVRETKSDAALQWQGTCRESQTTEWNWAHCWASMKSWIKNSRSKKPEVLLLLPLGLRTFRVYIFKLLVIILKTIVFKLLFSFLTKAHIHWYHPDNNIWSFKKAGQHRYCPKYQRTLSAESPVCL